MGNRDNLQGARLGSVNNHARLDRQKLHMLIRQILGPMAAAGSSRKINDIRADDGFNPVGHLKTGVGFDVAPNLNYVVGSRGNRCLGKIASVCPNHRPIAASRG
jgi:hypothetical protein